jgi:thiol-disulfide isomerase/thioredoxin
MIAMFVGLTLIRLPKNDDKRCYHDPANVRADEAFSLYGKTIQDEDFDWESLRRKYVLVKFTATWCPPCKAEIPGMLEAYEKYHDKGLEIVSVYIWESNASGKDIDKQIAGVKRAVQHEKLPWIILSEPQTIKANQPPQGEFFDIQGVPTMWLLDKEGKIITDNARGETLKRELKKLFE